MSRQSWLNRTFAVTALATLLTAAVFAVSAPRASAHSAGTGTAPSSPPPATASLPPAPAPQADQAVRVLVGDRAFGLPYRATPLLGSRVYVPVEAFAQFLGVDWAYDAATAALTFDGKPVSYGWQPAPFVQEGQLYAPVRTLAELVGASVHWDAATRTVHISAALTSEVWVTDQGTNMVHILSEQGVALESIDLNGQASKPHMVMLTPDHRYALVANVGSGSVAVIRTADRVVTDVIATDKGAHAAVPAPDGLSAVVAHTSGQSLLELVWDQGASTFVKGRRLDLAAAPELADKSLFPNGIAICPAYTADSQAIYVTLGGGGLVVVDAESFSIIRAYGKDVVAPNGCGLLLSPDGTKMYANSGTTTSSGLYIFDTANHDLLFSGETGGLDAHGVFFTPDGRYLVTLNRLSDSATFFDPATNQLVGQIPVGDAPDLPALSATGRFAYITLRGPNPATGTHDLAGTTPGINIIELASGKIIRTVSFSGGTASDPHGIAVRPVLLRP